MSDEVAVAVEIDGETLVAGTAYVDRRRSTTTTTFVYESGYLANPAAYAVDPALPLDSGRGFVAGLPGAFADCAPDRWGRRLIAKRIRAESSGRSARQISDLEYLLGVSDETRQGALRFRRSADTEFADPSADVPRMVRLPALLNAAQLVASDDDSDLSAIKILLDAGTGTLGGARPKASVRDDDGRLYIAKFPHPNDDWDVMAWEKTALDLAERAGIQTPDRLITRIDDRTVLLLARFDRDCGRRIGYMSALTLVQGTDGDDHDYADLAAELPDLAVDTHDDLEALWRRAAFSILVHNTDDHFRNHGFLRRRGGWRLSPVFDVNPNPDLGEERATSIGMATARDAELDGLMSVVGGFGIREPRAREILGEVAGATRDWRLVASSNGVPTAQLRRFEPAFEGLRAEVERIVSGRILR